jgi:phage terminase large subunit-like protein
MAARSNPLPIEFILADYCDGVLSGVVPACELVKASVRRHLADVDRAKDDGSPFYFDAAAAQLVIGFFGLLKHSKGQWAGEPFVLTPWQGFIVGMLFGWKRRSNDTRRFRTAYIEVPRKNGKSTFVAGIELYCLVADGEAGAEVYTVATKLDQAKLIFDEAVKMVKASPALRKHVRTLKNNLSVDATNSKCEPLGRDHDTLDGPNPSMIAADELHAHKDSGVWDVMDTATGSRTQPLKVAITTAGYNQVAICFDLHKSSIKLLEGSQTDDSFFCFIATVDKSDMEHWADADDPRQAWNDEEAWIKANPNWGVSVLPDDFRDMAVKAGNIPSQRPAFMTKRLDIWVSSAVAWLPIEKWDACGGETFDLEEFKGRRCWGGLDLANRRDLASLVLAFDRPEDGGLDIVCYSLMPSQIASERAHDDGAPYLEWADDPSAKLILTNGDTIDYEAIIKTILDAGRDFDLEFICADRWGLEFVQQALSGSGAMIVEFGQGYQSMGPAIEELERLIYAKLLHHDDNPVLRWTVSNVVSETSPQNKIRFNKRKSGNKIDPAVAMVMAVGAAMAGRGMKAHDFYESNELEFA